ncbi:phosphopantetheine adenylyltransferase [Vulcanisaeta souniana]|uniref:Phosphopantetheine adenylyltransferase n=1 Tax=Vulcanisaeta souniana JCM 11219 TaxID=1293586 RepID=A0A830E3I4_9CREN|nr:phosphopantetheine adenylyltransferase [Vulcanisaeta souniana]BDR93312.1 phosphopantetheine adenylyltransferase [Vulcanisaeta souniana JCM 11219]GGI79113.1 phosphopantetheine adenylyltransferase [Vulcanisaeta souniana JCM 11219]
MLRARFRKVAVGGTFDTLHTGHTALLFTALNYGRKVLIGVTSDEFAQAYKTYKVKPLKIRFLNLRSLIRELGGDDNNVIIDVINDPYGPTIVDPTVDAIVVSLETLPRAIEINNLRRERGLRPLFIIVVPIIKDGFGNKVSSTLIRDRTGTKELSD